MGEMGAVGDKNKYPAVALGERLRLTRALEQLEAGCGWYRCEYTKKPKMGCDIWNGAALKQLKPNAGDIYECRYKKNRGR